MKLISTLALRSFAIAAILLVIVATSSKAHAAPPVFWNVFEVTVKNNNTVEMNWLVTEYNNKGFWIEHSTDGFHWTEIGTIPSKNSPESLEDYHFTHTNNEAGRHFYRVRNMDVDEYATGFSRVRTIIIAKDRNNDVLISPNPANDHITIDNGEGNFTHAEIVDLFGKKISGTKLNTQVNRLDVSRMPKGTYFVKLIRVDGSHASGRFIRL